MAVPIRSCIVCRKRENWTDLLRVAVEADQILPDLAHRLPGRGAWLHRNCFDNAKQRGSFARAFRSEVPLSTQELQDYLQQQ